MRTAAALLLATALALMPALFAAGCGTRTGAAPFEELRYHLSGGIAGFDRTLQVAPGGEFQATDHGHPGAQGQLSSADLQGLQERIDRVQWPKLQPEYIDPRLADAIRETLAVKLGRDEYTVTVSTGGTPPGELADLLTYVREHMPR